MESLIFFICIDRPCMHRLANLVSDEIWKEMVG